MKCMFDIFTKWSDERLFAWYSSSSATHNVLLNIVNVVIIAILTSLAGWFFLKSRRFAQRFSIEENRTTPRYLRSLEKRIRLSRYWKSASVTQRIHFVALRVTLILCGFGTLLGCYGFFVLGLIINSSQEDSPKNIVALINAARDAGGYGKGIAVAAIEQIYVLPSMLLMCITTLFTFLAAFSLVVAILQTIRLAEVDDDQRLLRVINSIREFLKLPQLSEDSPILNQPGSFLFP